MDSPPPARCLQLPPHSVWQDIRLCHKNSHCPVWNGPPVCISHCDRDCFPYVLPPMPVHPGLSFQRPTYEIQLTASSFSYHFSRFGPLSIFYVLQTELLFPLIFTFSILCSRCITLHNQLLHDSCPHIAGAYLSRFSIHLY